MVTIMPLRYDLEPGLAPPDPHVEHFVPVRSIHPTNCSRSGRMQSSDELDELRSEIVEVKEQLKGANTQAEKTALQTSLAALREKEGC